MVKLDIFLITVTGQKIIKSNLAIKSAVYTAPFVLIKIHVNTVLYGINWKKIGPLQ